MRRDYMLARLRKHGYIIQFNSEGKVVCNGPLFPFSNRIFSSVTDLYNFVYGSK